MSQKEKIKSLIFNKDLRKRLNIDENKFKKLLKEYYIQNLASKNEKPEEVLVGFFAQNTNDYLGI